ncbi:MAG: nickel pincer cofactor biosynthesis protein LarB [Calditrichia bacterium]
MNINEISQLLEQFKTGATDRDQVLEAIKAAAVQDLQFATIDHQRELRQGFPEVIFCEGKTPEQVGEIAGRIFSRHRRVLATRANPELFAEVNQQIPELQYNTSGRCIHSPFPEQIPGSANAIAVVTAGTSDIPVAEEAAVTCRLFGFPPACIYDVGVAGLHRLNNHWETIRRARLLIVIAGMEGALASVIGGLVDKPVIAVPTSVGYGTSFGGLTALSGMLNSCASNVVVVNIDNGFGAAYTASLMLRQIIAAGSGSKGHQTKKAEDG